MKITNHLITNVVSEVAGEDTIQLVMALKNKKNYSEFKIADDIKEEIKEVRKKLYKLYNNNLVSFKRKKDKKKGWYIYYWTFNPSSVKYLYHDLRRKKISALRERLDREKDSYFFMCPNTCVRLDFDKATEYEFKCPECGSLMHQQDNRKTMDDIKEDIQRLEKELKVNSSS